MLETTQRKTPIVVNGVHLTREGPRPKAAMTIEAKAMAWDIASAIATGIGVVLIIGSVTVLAVALAPERHPPAQIGVDGGLRP